MATQSKKAKPARIPASEARVTVSVVYDVYNIPSCEGGFVTGYSCLGFEVAKGRIERYSRWTHERFGHLVGFADKAPNVAKALQGFMPEPRDVERYHLCMAVTSEMLSLMREQGARSTPVDLVPQLVGLEGKRVEVVTTYGETRRFIVGKSMGPIQIHLEIASSRSTGGAAAERDYKSIRVIG
jgi:hypothetical protein